MRNETGTASKENALFDSVVLVEYNAYNPHQFPFMAFNFILVFWLAALLCYSGHRRCVLTGPFGQLDETKRRNVVSYVLQLVATTVALGFQIYGGVDLLFRGEDTTTPERLEACIMTLIIICTLYIWELIYRTDIGLPLLLHHLISIFAIQIGWAGFFDTGSIPYFRFGVLVCFHATTEQISFIALYCYRMNLWRKYQFRLFQCAALQALVIKTAVTIAMFVFWAQGIQEGLFDNPWGMFWKVSAAPLLILLYSVQLYSAYILLVIGRRCKGDKLLQETDQSNDEEGNSRDFPQEQPSPRIRNLGGGSQRESQIFTKTEEP